MNLAISNIAWDRSQDSEVAEILKRHGVKGVELAPTKIWEKPLEATSDDIRAVRRFWEGHGLQIVAMQSLLFGRNDLALFQSRQKREEMTEYLKGMLRLASELGAKVNVFGSPRNRQRGELPLSDAMGIAVPFFLELGDYAASVNTCLCIEANAPQYNCDFITTSDEAWELVSSVGSEGFGLHLDLACMQLAGEDPLRQLEKHAHVMKHFHISAEKLAPVTAETNRLPMTYAEFLGWANEKRSDLYSSIEMTNPSGRLEAIEEAVQQVRWWR